MTEVDIKNPIWNGRCVGIATFRVPEDGMIKVNILYKNAEGERIYPKPLAIHSDEVRRCQTMNIKGSSVVVYVVKIADMHVIPQL